MRHSKNKDLKRRAAFLKIEKKALILNILKKNSFFPCKWKVYASGKFNMNFTYSSKIKNFCIYTYRGRGVVKDFKVSRHFFKSFASNGFYYGVKKSSW